MRRLLLLLAVLAWSGAARADVRRFAILAAASEGPPGTPPLLFAEDDLHRMRTVLVANGDFAEADVREVVPATRRGLLRAFGDLRYAVERARAAGDETLLLFYYSGHAEPDGLTPARGRLDYEELHELLARTGADVRVAILDACHAGAATRTKGGSRAPGFDIEVTERLDAWGTVVIASSTGDEVSQESQAIGGSYFTFYLVSGLAGSADRDGNGRVTLGEAYEFAYRETVLRTASTRAGAQHPTFDWDLSGTGELVLTRLDAAGAHLRFPPEARGAWAVFDLGRRIFVAEVDVRDAPVRLALPPGRYEVQQRRPSHLLVERIAIDEGEEAEVDPARLRPVPYDEDAAKEALARRARRARLPDGGIRLTVGPFGPGDVALRDQVLPAVPTAGISWRLAWRDGRWVAFDLLAGQAAGTLTIPGVPTVDLVAHAAAAGAAAGFCTPPRALQAGFGLRVDGIWVRRSFGDDTWLEDDGFLQLAPGLTWWVGWHPRRFELDLELRTDVVPYQFDDRDRGFAMVAALAAFGYRF